MFPHHANVIILVFKAQFVALSQNKGTKSTHLSTRHILGHDERCGFRKWKVLGTELMSVITSRGPSSDSYENFQFEGESEH